MREMVTLVFIGLIMAVCGISLVAQSIDPIRSRVDGIPGRVVIDECTWEGGRFKGWHCRGRFYGGTLFIEDVELGDRSHGHRPLGSVPAVVTGPHARTAWEPDTSSAWRLVPGLFFLGLSAWVFSPFLADFEVPRRSRRGRRATSEDADTARRIEMRLEAARRRKLKHPED